MIKEIRGTKRVRAVPMDGVQSLCQDYCMESDRGGAMLTACKAWWRELALEEEPGAFLDEITSGKLL